MVTSVARDCPEQSARLASMSEIEGRAFEARVVDNGVQITIGRCLPVTRRVEFPPLAGAGQRHPRH